MTISKSVPAPLKQQAATGQAGETNILTLLGVRQQIAMNATMLRVLLEVFRKTPAEMVNLEILCWRTLRLPCALECPSYQTTSHHGGRGVCGLCGTSQAFAKGNANDEECPTLRSITKNDKPRKLTTAQSFLGKSRVKVR